MGMTYEDMVGYRVAAPQYAYGGGGAAPQDTGSVTPVGPVGLPASVSVSGSFAIAGWLAGLIIALAAYRVVWERAG